MLSRFFLSFLIGASAFAADTNPVPPAPRPVVPVPVQPGNPPDLVPPQPVGPTATVTFDCVDGPGYLRITVIDAWGGHQSRIPFLGSRKACLAQAKVLRETRSRITHPSLIAVCGPKPTYQLRWQVDQFGGVTALPHTYYANSAECLTDAEALNRAP